MDRADEVALLRSMVDIPSASGAEGELAGWLADRMATLGFRTAVDDVGNVHGAIGAADGPELLLLGHLDTVPGALPIRLSGDMLYGRGTVDAKGPLAAMVCAARRVAGRVPARIVVVGAVDEERTSIGARHLARTVRPDAVVIGEPSGASCVGIGYKGVFRFRMETDQPAVHTSSPAPTAAEVVADFWCSVRDWLARGQCAPAGTAEPSLFGRALPTVLGLGGGLRHAWIDVSCRVAIDFDADEFRAVLARLALGSRITVIEQVPAVRSAPTDPVVRAFCAAIRAGGARPVRKLKLGTADWNVVGPAWGVPAAAYGPGDSRLCHAADERIAIPEYLIAIDVLSDALPRLAAALCGVATPVASHPRTGGTRRDH